MDYVKFYKIGEEPFRNDADSRFWFESRSQAAAHRRLLRGVHQRRALCLLVGAAGCGKSSLARHLLTSLDGNEWVVRLLSIPHRGCASGWLLPQIAAAFGVAQPDPQPVAAFGQLFDRLVRIAAAGRRSVLIVDEAQLLAQSEVMEELRGLINLESEGRGLLSLVMLGLPELDLVLQLDAPLAQRVDVRAELGPFDRADTCDYLGHRLKCAGGRPDLFTTEAVDVIWSCSGGVPRLINTLADNALFEGCSGRASAIDAALVWVAAEQLGLRPREQASDAQEHSAAVSAAAPSTATPAAVSFAVTPFASPARPLVPDPPVEPLHAPAGIRTASKPTLAPKPKPAPAAPRPQAPPPVPRAAATATGGPKLDSWEISLDEEESDHEFAFAASSARFEPAGATRKATRSAENPRPEAPAAAPAETASPAAPLQLESEIELDLVDETAELAPAELAPAELEPAELEPDDLEPDDLEPDDLAAVTEEDPLIGESTLVDSLFESIRTDRR